MQGKEAGRKSSLMRGMTDCILKFLHFLCMCASLRAVQRMGDQIHRGFQHPQTWLHSKSELNKKSLKLSTVTRAHPCLFTFCSVGSVLFC